MKKLLLLALLCPTSAYSFDLKDAQERSLANLEFLSTPSPFNGPQVAHVESYLNSKQLLRDDDLRRVYENNQSIHDILVSNNYEYHWKMRF